MKLLDKNNKYIDQFYSPSGGWSKKDFIKENKYFSMERISPYSLGSDSENWKLNNEEIISGRDRSGNEIYGTPAQQNSNYQLYTSYSSDFIENTTLKKYLSPYYFHDQINISEDVTLAVEPGVIIKFYNSNNFGGLTIQGILKAIGSEEEPIIFDSFRELIPWLGLYFTEKSANSELENIVVRRGGNKWGSYSGAGIKIKDTSVSLKNSILEDNYNQGLWLINSSSTIDNIEFLRHNRASSGNKGKAVYIDGGTPIIKNSTLKNNYYGIYIRNSEPVLENLIFGEDEEKNTCEIYKNGKCHK